MPYPNEHACRLRDPGDFQADSFRRMKRKHDGKTYSVIIGKLKGEDSTTEQAYRYAKDAWSASQARSHCNSHDGNFEAAGESDSVEQVPDVERRVLAFEQGEMRIASDEPRRLQGYAAKYGIQTDLGWFREKIKAGAFDEALKDSDARALKNHDPNLLLGRESSGTLRLESNTVGLRFEIDVPDTTTGRDTLEEVRRGDLAGCSFAFTVAEDQWKHKEGEQSERTIVRIGRLFDVGPVTYPAYEDTTVVARSVEAVREQREQEGEASEEEPEEKAPEISPERRREVDYSYREMGRIVNYVEDKNRSAENRPEKE